MAKSYLIISIYVDLGISGWRRNLKLANTNYILAIRAYNYSEFDGLSLLGSYISLSIVGYT